MRCEWCFPNNWAYIDFCTNKPFDADQKLHSTRIQWVELGQFETAAVYKDSRTTAIHGRSLKRICTNASLSRLRVSDVMCFFLKGALLQ